MRDNNIYDRYCNDFQNPALGAYIIAKFVESYIKNATNNSFPSIFHIFSIMPIIINSNFRKCIKRKNVLDSLIKEINENDKLFGTYQTNILRYKEYTMTCLLFCIRLNLISINDEGDIQITVQKLPNHKNKLIINAERLGMLFSNGALFRFLNFLGVSL